MNHRQMSQFVGALLLSLAASAWRPVYAETFDFGPGPEIPPGPGIRGNLNFPPHFPPQSTASLGSAYLERRATGEVELAVRRDGRLVEHPSDGPKALFDPAGKLVSLSEVLLLPDGRRKRVSSASELTNLETASYEAQYRKFVQPDAPKEFWLDIRQSALRETGTGYKRVKCKLDTTIFKNDGTAILDFTAVLSPNHTRAVRVQFGDDARVQSIGNLDRAEGPESYQDETGKDTIQALKRIRWQQFTGIRNAYLAARAKGPAIDSVRPGEHLHD